MKKGMVKDLREGIKLRDERIAELETIIICKEQTISLFYNILKFAKGGLDK